ncbi:MAG: D-alanine--D-alanine ligase [Salinivirgaceae bacterium]|jgi:D-alanine-D-alanine ligase|nr:D-alanine--D-alanine ligase [Salinivirgaceae bacterium]
MKTIAIVCGGYSKEDVISYKSAEQIEEGLDKSRYIVYKVFVSRQAWVVKTNAIDLPIDKNDFSFIHKGVKIRFDAVFMAIHGSPGEDGKLQSYFEMLNIPISTCNAFVAALTFNKYATKAYLKGYGIESAKAVVVRNDLHVDENSIIEKLGLPIFVKPNNGGSSFGVSKVKEKGQLKEAIEKALVEDVEAILEEFIEGKEVTDGVYCYGNEITALPITEIVSKTEFFDFEAKYEGLSDEITPARLSDEQTYECQSLSEKIYKLLNCKSLVRIDYIIRDNKFYFMEVNTVPGMSKESIIPQQVRATGMSVTDFYSKLIEDAIERNK